MPNNYSNIRFKVLILLAALLGILYLLVNIFVIGGDDFVYQLNNILNIPLAILTTFFAFSQWRWVATDRKSYRVWGYILAGWSLWTIAEILWAVYAEIYQEVPYPSPADYFWLAGYIPLTFGLFFRIQGVNIALKTGQKLILSATIVITILITILFILVPTIQYNDPANLLQSVLNIIYPLADLILLIVILRLFFIYAGGDFGTGWKLITAGFLIHSISNLLFSYAVLNELYYPDLRVNLLSGFGIDAPYNLTYLLWLLGLYALRLAAGKHHTFDNIAQPELVPNTSILLFLKGDDTVMEVSCNYIQVFGPINPRGTHLTEVFPTSAQDMQILLGEIHKTGRAKDKRIILTDKSGATSCVNINGLAITPDGEFTGCVLLLRMLFESDYSLDDTLSQYQRALIAHLRKINESNEHASIRKLLLDYHLLYLKHLSNLMTHTGGVPLSYAFLENLKQTAKENRWNLVFDTEHLILNSDYELRLLREALPALLEKARSIASQFTDPKVVDAEIQRVSSQISASVHKNVAHFSQPEPKIIQPEIKHL